MQLEEALTGLQQHFGGWSIPGNQAAPTTAQAPDADIDWELFDRLHRADLPCSRWLPRDVLVEARGIMRRLAESSPQQSAYMIILPKLLWPFVQEEKGRQRSRRIHQNITLALSGQWEALIQQSLALSAGQATKCPREEPSEPEPSQLERFVMQCQRGKPLGKAWKEATGQGQVQHSMPAWEQAQRLLKRMGDSMSQAGEQVAQHVLGPIRLPPLLRRLKQDKAADPGGWTHESLQQLLTGDGPVKEIAAWIEWISDRMEENHPLRARYWTSRAVLLSKPGGGTRPIVVSGIFQKLMAMHNCQVLQQSLPAAIKASQLGIGCPDGALKMAQTVLHAAATDEEVSALQLDMTNAFSTLRRDRIPPLLIEGHCLPEQRPLKEARVTRLLRLLGQPQVILPPTGLPNAPPLLTRDGLPQGDPLSSLLFGSCMAVLLNRTKTVMQGTVQCKAYLDDAAITGNMPALHIALPLLKGDLEAVGLTLNLTKCRLWRRVSDHTIPPLLAPHEAHVLQEGVVICGLACDGAYEDLMMPVGEPSFVAEWLRQKAERSAQEIRQIAHLPWAVPHKPSVQIANLLLKNLYPARYVHLMRAYAVEVTQESFEQVDAELLQVLKDWLVEPALTADQIAIARLPPDFGGLGWPSLGAETPLFRATALYTASRADPEIAEHLLDCCRREQPRLLADITCMVKKLAPAYTDLNSRPPDIHAKALLRRSRLASHHHTCEMLWKRSAMDDSPLGAWRLHTGYKPDMALKRPQGTGQWLTAKPTRQGYSLSQGQMQHGLKQRLGVPLQAAGSTCKNETAAGPCDTVLDPHGLHCTQCNRKHIIHRHHGIRDRLLEYAATAGLHTHLEPRVPGERPVDGTRRCKSTADGYFRTSLSAEVWIDVRVASVPHGADVLAALTQQEKAKAAEHGHPLAPVGFLAMEHVTPVVVERHGLLGQRAQAFVSWLYGHKARHLTKAGVPWAMAMHRAKRDLLVPLSLWLLKSDFWMWQSGTRGSCAV